MKKLSFLDVVAILSIVTFIVFANVVQADSHDDAKQVRSLIESTTYAEQFHTLGDTVKTFWKQAYLACMASGPDGSMFSGEPSKCFKYTNKSVLEVYNFWLDLNNKQGGK